MPKNHILSRRLFAAGAAAAITGPACAQIPGNNIPQTKQPSLIGRRPAPPVITPAETSTTVFADHFDTGNVQSFASFSEVLTAHAGATPSPEAIENLRLFFLNGGRKAIALDIVGGDAQTVVSAMQSRITNDLDFDFLCAPIAARLGAAAAGAIYAEGLAYAKSHQALLIMDSPDSGGDIAADWVKPIGVFDANAAMFAPRLKNGAFDGSIAASGAVCGVAARVDGARGIWKAAAGTANPITGASPTTFYSNAKIEQFANANINVIRSLAGPGTLIWGSRTTSSDPEWKYIPVRRMALFIEKSLNGGLDWTVFEPNKAPLWSKVKQSVDVFMTDLFRRGAFQGAKAEEAFFVRCDRTTMTQTDIDAGRLNVLVGFAPLRPAEFVVLRIAAKAVSAP